MNNEISRINSGQEEINSIIYEDTFDILSNPIRRKIIKYMFKNGGISYSLLSNKWKITTGAIYHHLKIMRPFIYQDTNYVYRLNEKGRKTCEWFLNPKFPEDKNNKILLDISYNLTKLLQKNQLVFSFFSFTILVVAFYLSRLLEIVIIGPFVLSINPKAILMKGISIKPILFLDVLILVGFLIQYLSIAYLLKKKASNFKLMTLFSGYLVSIIPSSFVVILLYLINLMVDITISLTLWILMSILSQLFLLITNNQILSQIEYNFEKSAIIVLSNSYLIIFVTYLLI